MSRSCHRGTPPGSAGRRAGSRDRSAARNPDVVSVSRVRATRLKSHRQHAPSPTGVGRAPGSRTRGATVSPTTRLAWTSAATRSAHAGGVVLAVGVDLHHRVVPRRWACRKAVRIAPPTPTLKGRTTTVAPASRARVPWCPSTRRRPRGRRRRGCAAAARRRPRRRWPPRSRRAPRSAAARPTSGITSRCPESGPARPRLAPEPTSGHPGRDPDREPPRRGRCVGAVRGGSAA